MANNVFQVKRTNVSGRTPNTTGSYGTNSQYIAAGEFALNMADGILYTSNGSAVIEIGANNTNQRITNSLTINNAKNLNFQTINTSAASYFTQQNDDNFVFYSTNTTYGARPIWGIFANSITSNLQVYVSLQLNSGLVANGSIGSPGQVLASNGSATYWTTAGGGSGTVTSVATGNGMTGGPITTTGTVSILANTGIVANSTGTFVDSTYIGTLTANNTSFVGSVSAANVVSNAQLSGNLANYVTTTNLTNNLANYQTTAGLSANVATLTANNTSFVGSVSAANVVSNAQLSANLANYQTTAGLSDNVATLTANNTSFVGSVSAANVVSNAQLSANLANYQTTAGLSANVATLTANNTSFVGSVSAANVVSNAQLSANLANYQTTAGLSANVATLTANNTSFVGTVSAANVVSNAQLSGNLANYAALAGATFTGAVVVSNNLTVTGNLTLSGNTVIVGANNLVVQDAIVSLHTPANLSPLTSNDGKNIGLAFHYYDTEDKHALLYRDNSTGRLQYHNDGSDPVTNTNPTGNNLGVIQANSFWAGNDSVYATTNSTVYTGTANNTSFVGSVSAANVVSNAQLSANLANYQTTAGLSANVATLTANNSTNLNGQPASFYTNASNITTGTLPWAQAPTGTVNTSGNFTLSGNTTLAGTNTTISSNLNITGAFVNAVSYYSGTLLVANTTVINATHLAGVAGASYVQNTDSRTLSGNLVISGTSFTPSSNTILLGNSTQRWVLSANSGNFTGSITSSQGANAIILTNATSNWIWWPASAISAPTTTTRSVGTRLVLWPNLSGSTVDYAIGIENGTLWQSVTSTSDQFRWYASTTNFMSANIAGLYHTGLVNAASFTTTGTTSNTSGVYPTSNTSGQTLGSATQRWVLSANTGTFSGNVAIGTTNTTAYTLNVNGSFAAVTKSFVISHPTKPDMKLRYASLEGPENGVYVRGKIEGKSIIELPDYWWNLIDQDTITVNLTPYGRSQDIWVQSTCAHFIHLNQPADCFFTVFAERKDVDKLVVEY